jgi:hypothetical protein
VIIPEEESAAMQRIRRHSGSIASAHFAPDSNGIPARVLAENGRLACDFF